MTQEHKRVLIILVAGFANLNHISCGFECAKRHGKSVSYLCKKIGVEIDTATDQRFGKVNTYPADVLREVFINSE